MTIERRREISRNWGRRKNGSTPASLAKSVTWFARNWEQKMASQLGAKDMNDDGMGKPYDLDLNGQRINLKVSHPYYRKSKRGKPVQSQSGWWRFNASKGECDFYLCILLNDDDAIEQMLLVPSAIMCANKRGITTGAKCAKYSDFIFSV